MGCFSSGITRQSGEEDFCLVSPCLTSSFPTFPRGLTSPARADLTAQDRKGQKLWLMEKVEVLPEHLQGALRVWGRRKYPSCASDGDGGWLCSRAPSPLLLVSPCARAAGNCPEPAVALPWLLAASRGGCLLAPRLQV